MNNKYIIGGIIVALLLFFGWREYGHYVEKKAIEDSYEAVISYKDGERNQLKNSLDLEVADKVIMKQNIMSEKVAKEQLKEELEGYKDLTAYMKSEVVTSIKNLEAKYDKAERDQFDGIDIKDGEYIHKNDVDKNFVRVPTTFGHKDDWMYFAGTINKHSTILDSLYLINKFDATIGSKKSEKSFSWLRKKEPTVELKSYNPYTEVTYVNNVVINDDKGKIGNILLSKPAMFVYGVLTGVAIN